MDKVCDVCSTPLAKNNRSRMCRRHYRQNYRKINRVLESARTREWHARNPNKAKEYAKLQRSKTKYKTREKEYRKSKKYKEWATRYHKERRRRDINYRIAQNIRNRVRKAIMGLSKSLRTRDLIGCSLEMLKTHIESQFKPGMTWDNYGDWHIDHVVPLSSFDLSKEDQLRTACNYKNLQPLWAQENISKGAKLNHATDVRKTK
ncbi:MAG: hypothetical protein QXG63_03420 [Nitrososphaerales archaeon]